METKICRDCGVEKPITEFWARSKQCKVCNRKMQKEYRLKNKEKRKQYDADYYKNNKQLIIKKKKEYAKKNKEKIKERMKAYRIKNKEKIKMKINKYIQQRKKIDDIFLFKYNLKATLRDMFNKKGLVQKSYIEEITGCECIYLYEHLLKTFQSNYGYKWDEKEIVHIDHIIPLSIAKTKQKVIELNHYTNLQLLKEKDNIDKGNKLYYKLKK